MYFNKFISLFLSFFSKYLLVLFIFSSTLLFSQETLSQNKLETKTQSLEVTSQKVKLPKGLSISLDIGYSPVAWGISNAIGGASLAVKNFQLSFLDDGSIGGPLSLQGIGAGLNIEYRGIPNLEFLFIRIAPSFEYTLPASYLIKGDLERILDRFGITELLGDYSTILTLLDATLIPLLEFFGIDNLALPKSLLVELGIDYSNLYQVSVPVLIGIEVFHSSKMQFYTGIGFNYTYATLTVQEVGIREAKNSLLGFNLSNIPVSNTFTMHVLGLSMVLGAKFFVTKNIFVYSEIEFKHSRGVASINKPEPIDGESNFSGAIDEFNRLVSDLDAQLTDDVVDFITDLTIGIGQGYIEDYLIIILENISPGPFAPNTNKYDRTSTNLSTIKYHIGIGYQF